MGWVRNENVSVLDEKIVDKFMKFSKMRFSMECFTTDFLRFTRTSVKICLMGGWLSTGYQI